MAGRLGGDEGEKRTGAVRVSMIAGREDDAGEREGGFVRGWWAKNCERQVGEGW
jgi:hypothetical protein